MTRVSFAQHGEDVVLHRALGHIREGFWVDVGAGDPEVDSVTALFSGLGWRGINIEPEPGLCARLAAARPRDVTLCCAAGAAAGRRVLHRIPDSGLSTLDPAIAARHAAEGLEVEPIEVEVRRLADICDAHAPRSIQFLKVDAEGHEAAVLAGADFARHRPSVVVVEATEPNRPEPSHAAWEPGLLAAGYVFVRFDGLNRWYVAAEQEAALAAALVLPPTPFDGFVRLAEVRAWQRAEAAEAAAREASARAAAAEEALAAADRRAETAERRRAAAAEAAARAEARAIAAEAAAAAADARATTARAEAEAAAAREAAARDVADRRAAEADAARTEAARLEARLAAAEAAARAAAEAEAVLAAGTRRAEAAAARARAEAAAAVARATAAAALSGALAARLVEAQAAARDAEERARRHAEAEARAARALAEQQAEAAAARAEAESRAAALAAAETHGRWAEGVAREARAAADETHQALQAMAERAGAEWQRAEALAREVAALRASPSWRLTRPLRALGWLARGRPGAALAEAGVPAARLARLATAAGRGPGAPLRAIAFLAGEAVVARPALHRAALSLRSRAPWLTAWAERGWRMGRAAAQAAAEPPLPGLAPAADGAPMSPEAARVLARIRLLRGEAGG